MSPGPTTLKGTARKNVGKKKTPKHYSDFTLSNDQISTSSTKGDTEGAPIPCKSLGEIAIAIYIYIYISASTDVLCVPEML